jgi:hypothetical protein
MYAWWLADAEALPNVPATPHRSMPLGLLYVGAAPVQTLDTRVCENHLASTLDGSALRRTLTAFLWEHHEWRPFMVRAKPALAPAQCQALTDWMRQHLWLAWCAVDDPTQYEAAVIRDERMRPPLNKKYNTDHPFYPTLRATYDRFRQAALAGRAHTHRPALTTAAMDEPRHLRRRIGHTANPAIALRGEPEAVGEA